MTLGMLQNEMVNAMKSRNSLRRNVIAGIIARVKRTAIDKGMREDITEEMVNQELLKTKKMTQEQIDTCPANRPEMLETYKREMDIVMEFCPSLIEDESEIRSMILGSGFFVTGDKSCQGKVMKYMKENFAGKVDMKKVSQIFKEMF